MVSLIWKVKWGNKPNMSHPVNGLDQFPPDGRSMMYEWKLVMDRWIRRLLPVLIERPVSGDQY
jgi:hypothetical protein